MGWLGINLTPKYKDKKKKKQNLDGKGVEEWRRSHGFQIWILDIFEVCLHAVDISSDGQFRTETDM